MKGLWSILLLIVSNSFMTIAWYGHLKYQNVSKNALLGLLGIVLASWGIALFLPGTRKQDRLPGDRRSFLTG